MRDRSCAPEVKALVKKLDKSFKELEQSFEKKRVRFDENIVPKIVTTCSRIVELIKKESESVMKDCTRKSYVAHIKNMVKRCVDMFARLAEWIHSFSDFAPKTMRLIDEWLGRMRSVVSQVLAYSVKLIDFLNAHKYRILIAVCAILFAHKNKDALRMVYDLRIDSVTHIISGLMGLSAELFCHVDWGNNLLLICAMTTLYSMHCNVLALEEEAQKNMREGFNQAVQRHNVKKFFKQTLGESHLNDELAFAYADAFESASDVVAARMQSMIASNRDNVSSGSTLKNGISTAASVMKGGVSAGKSAISAGASAGVSAKRKLSDPRLVRNMFDAAARAANMMSYGMLHFLHTMRRLLNSKAELVSTLWHATSVKMVAVLFLLQGACAARNAIVGTQTFLEEFGTFNQFQATPGVLIRGCKRLIGAMLSETPGKATATPIVYREIRLGPFLLKWLTKLGSVYLASSTGWYLLKQLSFAFNDRTKRITMKKDAIQSVVTGLGDPLSLDELVDSTDDAVATLTGNDMIRTQSVRPDGVAILKAS